MSDLKKKFEAAAKDVLKAKKDPGNDMKLKGTPTEKAMEAYVKLVERVTRD